MKFEQEAFGKRIAETRKELGYTQASLAEAMGLSVKYMGAIEQGKKVCTIENLVSLSELLHVSADYLLKGETQEKDEAKSRLQKALQEMESAIKAL